MTRLVVIAGLVASTLLSSSADAKCAMQHLAVQILPDAPNGAIVMERSATDEGPDAGARTGWTLRADGKDVAPVIDTLAPGLVVYRLPKGMEAAELTDGKTTLAKLTARARTSLPAPKVKSVMHDEGTANIRKRSERTTATIQGAVPADAVAIVITDEKGTPLSFGLVERGEPLEPYFHGRCSVLPNGTVPPVPGSRVRLFWVDKYGQPSAKSSPIKVTKAP